MYMYTRVVDGTYIRATSNCDAKSRLAYYNYESQFNESRTVG